MQSRILTNVAMGYVSLIQGFVISVNIHTSNKCYDITSPNFAISPNISLQRTTHRF
ncbi:hypothetical protein MADA3029_650113 [Vibrio nigripulchritudo MADA3029]|nr:hypothetical protein VIBNIAM115_690020 [Vibrio nigripulchritudo AM115]CCN48582.1 hypothetical protein VIBNIMADA3020_60083 [Vibrio nigripulchritudo MADA3020]CCN60789.1 hypothetical protein MADA3029_650113 [Vibrio nigripulchritudo MADA3029]CCN78557.1 hypothetical protein VIBNISO65_670019 [Vibrio nigripulchritudo SO65]